MADSAEIDMKEFWETCDTDFAHITTGKYQTYEYMVGVWHKEFLKNYDWQEQTVVDYGCGGGHLCRALREYGWRGKYVGVDIAKRQLCSAEATLKEIGHEEYDLLLLPQKLSSIKADILVCQAVMQHMAPQDYFPFLDNVNNSGIKDVVLQWRDGNLRFNERSVRFRCFTDYRQILLSLSSYKLDFINKVRWRKVRYGGFGLETHTNTGKVRQQGIT